MWETHLIKTVRGTFEYFTYGHGEPMAVTHHYSEYNANGNTFGRALAEQ